MSKKKKASSRTPSDQFTWSSGSSMLLDTFRHDMEEGEGVSDGGRLPQTKGLSSLPPDLLTPEDSSAAPYGTQNYTHNGGAQGRAALDESIFDGGLIDMNVVLSNDADRLPALDWLDDASLESDAERLPKNPIDIVPELEEAWGVRRRTDGLSLDNPMSAVATRLQSGSLDLDHVREAPLEKQKRFSKDQIRSVRRLASRKIAAGQDLRSVISEVSQILGEESYKARKHLAKLKKEVGLLGNVYIKAASYPDCDQGEWTEHVQQNSRTAKYVVSGRKCAGCVFASGGACRMFGRDLVASVPWEEAREAYRPYFNHDGIKVASTGSAKAALRRAFASDAVSTSLIQTEFVSDTSNVLDRLEAKLSSESVEKMHSELAETRARQGQLQRQKLAATLHKLAEIGQLTETQVEVLLDSKASSGKIFRRARKMATENQLAVGQFQGTEQFAHQNSPESYQYTKKASKSEVRSALESTRRWLNEGMSGEKLDQLLASSLSQPVRTASDKKISTLRNKHEGLAGHLYVVAEAYGKTAKGCDEGARRHRNQDTPYVLKMASCDGCVFRNQHDNCTKYAKELVSRDEFSESELTVFRDRMVETTNLSDAERSASFFAPSTDPTEEFGLRNTALEDFDYHKEAGSLEVDMEDPFDL